MTTDAAVSPGSDELDLKYGPCLEAGRPILAQEYHCRPASLQMLSNETAGEIKQYLATATNGLLIPGAIHRVHPILWLIDFVGHVWFAVEEVINEDSDFIYTMGRGTELPKGHYKLGHPSLLMSTTDKRARIGGEIKFHAPTSTWRISNRSGRYGMRDHQVEAHLLAAAELFAQYQIHLVPSFWPLKAS
ncbi:hypothetical protein E2F50_13210 [Rhizobium deserti]|uniref:Uncharacterized protein n=1 Tax=Rhizobium deserti TaxID=2547961 RepID=A0A4R5UGZ3_9HYPH|nr:hypothetical protein [Rhizobium deserti]TDK35211.1 hypothetical protein E2F50_13210 [Rhizobium deserti]